MLEDIEQLAYGYYPLDMIECNLYMHLSNVIKIKRTYLECSSVMSESTFVKHRKYIEDFFRLNKHKCTIIWKCLSIHLPTYPYDLSSYREYMKIDISRYLH